MNSTVWETTVTSSSNEVKNINSTTLNYSEFYSNGTTLNYSEFYSNGTTLNYSEFYSNGTTLNYSEFYSNGTTLDYAEYYSNGIDDDSSPCDYYVHTKHFLPVLYSLFFVVGLLGNMLVLWVILRGSQIKSMTDVSLLNLAIADLLLIFSLPFLAHYARGSWVFGNGMCTLVLSVYYIGFYSGIFFIVLMSIDRYLAIVHAVFALRIRTRAYGIFASIFVWILAVIASFPELLYLGVEKNGTVICSAYPKDTNHNNVRSGAFFKMNVLGLLIPLIIVGFCYSMVLRKLQTLRNSTKLAVRLVIVVMVVFFCCWIPYNIAAFLKALELKLILTPECELSKKIQLLLQVTEAVAYSHSCLNPFLYVLVGEKFRRHLARLLLHTPCSDVQCMKVYMTRAASSVYSQSTSMEERSTAH